MNLDGITLHCITNELVSILQGGAISKIYQLDQRSLYFRIFNETGIHHLIITLDDAPRLYISNRVPPTPDVPTGLCMFLRKYYENGRIASIKQLHLDRLIDIDVDILDVSGKLVTRKIHVELMGKYSNVIFTEDGIIIEALIKTAKGKTAVRTIAPKTPYEFPPNFMRMDPFEFSPSEIKEMLDMNDDEPLSKWMLKRFNGISTLVLNELSYRTDIDTSQSVASLTDQEKTCWAQSIYEFGTELKGIEGAYVYTVGAKEVIFPLELKSLAAYPRRHFTRIGEYLSDYQLTHHILNGEHIELQKKVSKLIEKQKRKIKRIAQEMKETSKMDTYKLYGDLLMIYAYEKHDHEEQVTLRNLLSPEQEPVTIALNPAYSMTDNANRYYKRYTKMRNRIQKSGELHKENEDYLNYLYSLEYALENASTKAEIADIKAEMHAMGLIKSSSKDKLRREFSQDILTVVIDGLEIWIGRNNRQNDFLTFKKAHPYDLWFHVKNRPGSHVILACHHAKPSNRQLEAAAELAAYYSKGRNDGKVEVDCTLVRNVKKPSHGAPGFVVFEGQDTYNVTPKKWESTE